MTNPDLDLDKLEALEKAATPGPWVIDDANNELIAIMDREDCYDYLADFMPAPCTLDYKKASANAAFIAALRNAAPALFAAARDGLKWRAEGWRDLDVLRDQLAAAQARIKELEEALTPFVEWSKRDLATANELQPNFTRYDDDCEADVAEFDGNGTHPMLWGDFRRAASALRGTK